VIRLCETATGKELQCWGPYAASAGLLGYGPDGLCVAMGEEGRVRLWKAGKNEHWLLQGGRAFYPDPYVMAFSDDCKYLVCGHRDHSASVRQVASSKELRRFQGHLDNIAAATISPDGKTLATGSEDHTIRLWELDTGKDVGPHGGHDAAVLTVAFAPDGRTLATGSADRTIRLWDARTGQELRRLTGHPSYVQSLVYAPDGQTLASLGSYQGVVHEHTFHLWDTRTGKELRQLDKDQLSDIVFAPNGKTVFAAHPDYSIYLWDPATGKEAGHFQGRTPLETDRSSNVLYSIAVSPDGQVLAGAGTDNAVHLWQIPDGKEVRRLVHDETGVASDWIRQVCFSPEGRTVASVSYNQIRLWDWSTGKELHRLDGHSRETTVAAFSPDGRTLASGGTDNVVRLWEVATGRERGRLQGHGGRITSLSFAPGGRLLASGSSDTTALIWDLARQGQRLPAGKMFTDEELEQLWADLASDDASKAYGALWSLAVSPERASALVKKRLSPVAPVEPQRLAQLLADLDSERFTVRDRATTELERLGELAEPTLRKMLDEKPSLEVRTRLERLLKIAERHRQSAKWFQHLRTVELLEQMATPAARQLLNSLAAGDPAARLTGEAKAAAERLAKRGVD
jgi:WD40 repeat protein